MNDQRKSIDEMTRALDADGLACLKYLSSIVAPLLQDKGMAAVVAAIEVLSHPDWLPLVAVTVKEGPARVGAPVWEAYQRAQEEDGT